MTDERSWTPARALELSGSYWSACALHAGLKLGVFSALAGEFRDAATVADITRTDARALAMLLEALAALGLLQVQGGRYANSEFARLYLVREADGYLGHIMLHHHHLMASWAQLHASVRSGRPAHVGSGDDADAEERRTSFLLGMYNLAHTLAPQLAPLLALSRRSRLLDLGGGPGTYALHFCRHYPQLRAEIFDLPTTRPFAERTIARFNLADRVTFQSGDYLRDPVAGRFDVAWLSHILHGEGPDGCRKIIEHAVAALDPGGMIIVQEFILDDAVPGPLFPALFSLNMLLVTEQGQAYREEELRRMLTDAGVKDVRRLQHGLPNPGGLLIGTI